MPPSNLEADDLIVEKLYAEKTPEKITVVTSDKELSYRVKEVGGMVMSCKAFLSLLKRRTKKEKPSEKPNDDSVKRKKQLEQVFLKRIEDATE